VLDEIIRGYNCGFECSRPVTDYIYPAFLRYLTINRNTVQQYISCLWTSSKPLIHVGRGALHYILSVFGMPVKLVLLIKTF
jgi:hypothetical protein